EIYTMGALAQPKQLPYVEKMTLVSAIAGAGGTIKESYLSHVAIVRGSLSQPKIAIVDYKDIIKGKAADIVLEPQDIIYVPYKPYRYLNRYADLILSTFVTSMAINEGSRAVAGNQVAPTGVVIPLGSRITVQPPAPAPTTR
ncbi:MAG: hypothetical protein M3Y82_09955, partial [Verrucomicrobiota bacterium]|nr:hypothetical protein [Verrucomicrobiota bacterium]